jgi:hypothetical protein
VEPEPQEPKLFALAEPKPECIKVPVPEPDLDPDPTQNGIKKLKKSKKRGKHSGEKILLLTMKRQDFVKIL